MRAALSALAAAAVMITGPALAQQSPMPEDLAWMLLELGRVIDQPRTAALHPPLQQKESHDGVKREERQVGRYLPPRSLRSLSQ